jgi:hypothetical protein
MTDQSVIVKTAAGFPCAAVTSRLGAAFAAGCKTLLRWQRAKGKAGQFDGGGHGRVPISHTQTVMEGASHCDFRFTKKT